MKTAVSFLEINATLGARLGVGRHPVLRLLKPRISVVLQTIVFFTRQALVPFYLVMKTHLKATLPACNVAVQNQVMYLTT